MADPKDVKEDISEDELDQIIQDMSKDESSEDVKPVLEVVQSKKKTPVSASNQALTLEMNGVVNLKLHFKNGDRSIEVLCSEDYLTCRMADGTEFKIPTGNGKVRKVA